MNTGNSRVYQIIVHKTINCVVDLNTEHKLTDEFTINNITYGFIGDPTNLLSLSISEYNDRVNAFKTYIESLPDYTNYTLNISNLVQPDVNCSTGTTVTYETEFSNYQCIVETVNDPTYYHLYIINDTQFGSTTGEGDYLSGTTANYSVTPSSGYTFVGWEKCDSSGCTESYFINYNEFGEILMDSDKYLRTVYKAISGDTPTIYRLTLINDFTKGDTKISGKYADYADFMSGATANFQAIPKNGYEFVRWDVCSGSTYTTSGSTSVYMDDNKCFTSVYRRKFELTIINDDNIGTVNGAGIYYEGDLAYYSVTIINSGYTFGGWSKCSDNSTVSIQLNDKITMNSDKCLRTNYIPISQTPTYYSLTIENDNTKGSVSGAGSYLSGTTAIFGVTGNTNYEFVRWEVCSTNATYSTGRTDNILMNSDKCLRTVYQKKPVEIFFNNIFDKYGIDHVNNIPNDSDGNRIEYSGGYPLILGTPDYGDIEKYIDAMIQVRGYNYPIASSYYNIKAPDQLSEQYVNAKIGVSGDTTDSFTYKIKVSTFLGGENNVLEKYEYHRGSNVDWSNYIGGKIVEGGITGAGISAAQIGIVSSEIGSSLFKFGYNVITKTGNNVKYLPFFNNTSSYNAGRGFWKGLSNAIGKGAGKGLSEAQKFMSVGAAMEVISVVALVIQITDIIWDFTRENDIVHNVLNDIYRMTRGLYNNDSIKESKVKMNITSDQNAFGDVDSVLNSNILDNNYYSYVDVKDYIASTNNHGAYVTGDNYKVTTDNVKFDFFPRGDQYDVSVPPPFTYYRIELEAIDGCYLSETKPIAFGFLVAPDKFATPSFDIVPKNAYWNYGEYAVFKDAKYCDYILLNDLKSNNTNKLLRWFNDNLNFRPLDDYHNYYLGTFGNDKYVQQNIDIYPNEPTYSGRIDKIRDKNYVRKIDDLFTLTRDSGQVVHEYGEYEVVFCNEKFPQLVMNHTFIDRIDIGDPYLNYIKKYWVYDENDGWKIKNGAMYKSFSTGSGESSIYQDLSGLECSVAGTYRRKYRVVIDVVVNSGYFYLDCANVFDVNLWEIPSHIYPISTPVSGVTLNRTSKRVEISRTMRFNYFLATDNNPNTFISRLKIGASSDCNGYIKECIVQRLHSAKAFESERFLPLKSFNIEVINNPIVKEFYFTYKYDGTQYFNNPLFDINIKPKTEFGKQPKVTVDFGDGVVSGYTVQGGFIMIPSFSIQHTYSNNSNVSNGEYLIKMTFTDVKSIDSLVCRSSGLISLFDSENLLFGGSLDLSYTSIGYPSRTMANATTKKPSGYRRDSLVVYTDSYVNNYYNGMYFNPFTDIYKLKSLYLNNIRFLNADLTDICNTITDELSVSYVTNPDILYEVSVSYRNGIAQVPVTGATEVQPFITGDLGFLIDTKNKIYLDNTHVSRYSDRYNIECKDITWVNHRSGYTPTQYDLNRLIFDLYNSTLYGGKLKIDTNNPPITDPDILNHINEMVSTRNWVIYYNKGGDLIVYNGTGSGLYYKDQIVNIVAKDAVPDYVFDKWVVESGNVVYVNGSSETTPNAQIKIGVENIKINATYRKL